MSTLARLLAAVKRLLEANATLTRFAPWPDDPSAQQVMPVPCPAAQSLGQRALPGALPGTCLSAPVIRALRRAAPEMEWRRTYTGEEVGARVLETYGYVELLGPTGHFISQKLRGHLGDWGPDLTYDWHAHEAEELYDTLSGAAVFSAKDAPDALMRVGDARFHTSCQPHLMITLERPSLACALLRGEGMAGLPMMSAS